MQPKETPRLPRLIRQQFRPFDVALRDNTFRVPSIDQALRVRYAQSMHGTRTMLLASYHSEEPTLPPHQVEKLYQHLFYNSLLTESQSKALDTVLEPSSSKALLD